MKRDEINASPTKAFFIENLTRDLTLEDAILDLVDNSIDSAIHLTDMDVSASLLLRREDSPKNDKIPIHIEVGPERIVVEDWAEGIDPNRARNDVFRLGRSPAQSESTLGVYGIGLKRAVFKMGRRITISSWHKNGAFEVEITPEWLNKESDWTLRMNKLDPDSRRGTRIVIEDLREEIRLRVGDPKLLKRLSDALSRTYGLFLQHLVDVELNKKKIQAGEIPLGSSEEVFSGKRELTCDGVSVEVLTGLAPRDGSRWEMEKAGWYVLCNGRVVVSADKSELTGWGSVGPQFNPKHRGFVGVVFFFSSDPSKLPWTTTKRGLNQESKVFQLARHEMVGAARPVLTFLNDMYASETSREEVEERRLANTVKTTPLHELASAEDRHFSTVKKEESKKQATTSVQFKVPKADITRAKKCLGKPRWSNGRVGQHAFEYFLEQECPE